MYILRGFESVGHNVGSETFLTDHKNRVNNSVSRCGGDTKSKRSFRLLRGLFQ